MSREEELQLFKRLIKDGAQWRGDVIDKKWGECLYVPHDKQDAVRRTLTGYFESIEYTWDKYGALWIK